MRIEQTNGQLRTLSEQLFSFVESLSGEAPQFVADWYRARTNGKTFVYLRLIGERARKFPPNSIHLATKWDEGLSSEQIVRGDNWFGEPSADLSVQAESPAALEHAEKFILRAFQLYG